MALQETLIKKLEYQIFTWQKQIDKAKAEARRKQDFAENDDAIDKIEQELQEYVQRIERNLAAARKKIEEVREADDKKLIKLKKQISDWVD
jgi:hypothetical protein